MTKKQLIKQLAALRDCYEKRISTPELCKQLGVTKSGLGTRIIKLKRMELSTGGNG